MHASGGDRFHARFFCSVNSRGMAGRGELWYNITKGPGQGRSNKMGDKDMIELKLRVSEVDFEAAIRLFTGNGISGVAAMAARALPDSAKEELAVKYLNGSADKLSAMLETAAKNQGVHLRVTDARAVVVQEI